MEFLIGGVIFAVVAFVAYKKWPWFHAEVDSVYDKVDSKVEQKPEAPAPTANTGS